MKSKSPLSSRFSHLATAGLVAGSLLAANPAARAQGVVNANETFDWSTTFSSASSGGTVFYPGAVASGTITFNPSTLTPDSSGGGFDAVANISYGVTYGGRTVNYNSYSDLYASYGSGPGELALEWDQQGDSFTLSLTTPPSGLDSPSSIQAALISAANNGYDAQNSYSGLSDTSGANWGIGPVTSFQVEATPEPGTLALGGLGAAALVAARLRSRIKQNRAQKTVGLNAGM